MLCSDFRKGLVNQVVQIFWGGGGRLDFLKVFVPLLNPSNLLVFVKLAKELTFIAGSDLHPLKGM